MKWTKCVVELSEAEEVTLQQLSIKHRHRDTRTRAAGVLMLGRGLKPRAIAAQLDVSGQTVYNWFHAWRDSGVCGLMGGHNGGRAPALSEGMVATALEVARAEPLTLAQNVIEPNHHCRRNVVAALNFADNSFVYAASARTVKGPDIVGFLDTLIRQGDGRPTVIVLDNASIHHSIDAATLDRWFIVSGEFSPPNR